MGERNAGVGGNGDRRRDAGNDLEGDAGRRQRLGLLAAAAENEGITALESDDALALPRSGDEQPDDLVLFDTLTAAVLADQHALGPLRGVVEQARIGQVVVDDHIAALQAAHSIDGDQPGASRPGADQIHRSRRAAHDRASISRSNRAPPLLRRRLASSSPSAHAAARGPQISSRNTGAPLG